MNIRCPRCGKETQFKDNPFRPFCCERCKLLDLGKWLSGSYGIPAIENEEEKQAVPDKESEDP